MERCRPSLFRAVTPAWNNQNLLSLARVTRSPALLAHVRAASHQLPVALTNCHPFVADRYSFMHNGRIGEFPRLKRRLANILSDNAFDAIAGGTDSEYLFALFRDRLQAAAPLRGLPALRAALIATIRDTVAFTRAEGVRESTLLNLAISDGTHAIASRFVDLPDARPESLYFITGREYRCHEGSCQMLDAAQSHAAVIIASEPLSEASAWRAVPRNHLVTVAADHAVALEPIPVE